ncbi:hypothetical protein ABJB38_01900 [Bifidobacterium bifidum]|nr:hypothetical protein [Bifidobacterium bifidum]MCZ4481068.1 hypothetical protein [Bifidobacterium bifidum]MDB1199087.1 hypothetical protein [Bifidobacterium bifidum]MDB1206005.1 hypothetical protein [Bifidobacterium bifidum]MDB1212959.1 hypothetical protein [Bifidobacterium bifidum]MDB1214371.1 hypothetical protein [Bifidobacterium bifidum]
MRGQAGRVRAPAGRGGRELHPGRPCGRGVETHRQGLEERTRPGHRQERETIGGLVSFHHGQAQEDTRPLSGPGGTHPDRRPAAPGRRHTRHRPPP